MSQTVQNFGPNPLSDWVEIPVGKVCMWCDEEIGPDDRGQMIWHVSATEGQYMPHHQECLLREIVGSVGHQNGDCSCCGGDGTGDPEGLTPREAAKAAVKLFRERNPQ